MQEEKHPPRILICILCGYERHYWISPQLMEFLVGTRYNENYEVLITKAYNFIPAAAARNFIGKQVKNIEPGPDWVLMIDADMGPSDNLLDSIKDAPDDAMVVVPRFHLWDGDEGMTKLCWGIDDSKLVELGDGMKGYKLDSKFYELVKCGTGAIFIRPEVFRRLPEPWFEYKHDELGNLVATEDIIFVQKVVNAGMKIYGNAAINVGHFHTVDICKINSIIHNLKYKKLEEACEV